jgi:hypothetical protein
MGSQFVDFNEDGHNDYITATFDGSVWVSFGSEQGFGEPQFITDAEGQRLIICSYWDYDKETHLNDGRALPGGKANDVRCISAFAFDWDADGDYDLLLGSYEKGLLYRQMNEGSNQQPKFTGQNIAVTAGGVPISLLGKMTTARLVDWDGDGDQDLLVGSFDAETSEVQSAPEIETRGGSIYLALNQGTLGAPDFSALTPLIETASNGGSAPTGPNEGLYFDGDGDLDLVVGAYSIWTPIGKDLTIEEEQLVAELRQQQTENYEAFSQAEDDSSRQAAYKAIGKTSEALDALVPSPERNGFIWWYERKGGKAQG